MGRFVVVGVVLVSVSVRAQELRPVNLQETGLDTLLPPPHVIGATSCPSGGRLRVALSGGKSGAWYEVLEGDPKDPTAMKSLGTFPVSPDVRDVTYSEVGLNSTAPVLVAVQHDGLGTTSAASEPYQVEDPANRSVTVELPPLVFACGRATAARGQLPGDRLILRGTDPQSGTYERWRLDPAVSSHEYLPIGPQMFNFDEDLVLEVLACDASPNAWATRTVEHRGGQQLVRPKFGVVLPGGLSFVVRAIVTGALLRVTLTRGANQVEWTEACGADGPCTAFIPAPFGTLEPADKIEVTQELCDGSQSAVESTEVADCSSVVPPEVVDWPRFGDRLTTLKLSPPGALNVALVGSEFDSRIGLRAIGSSGGDVVAFSRSLEPSDMWLVVAQPTPLCPSPIGADYSIIP